MNHSTICKQHSTCIKNDKHLDWIDSILFFLKGYVSTSKIFNNVKGSKLGDLSTHVVSY